jgi:hypothetical protein
LFALLAGRFSSLYPFHPVGFPEPEAVGSPHCKTNKPSVVSLWQKDKSKYLAFASADNLVIVKGALDVSSEITIAPQLVSIVIVLGSDFATAIGSLTVAGACALAVGVLHPGTVVGFSAACIGAIEKADTNTTANTKDIFFTFIPIQSFLAVYLSHPTRLY